MWLFQALSNPNLTSRLDIVMVPAHNAVHNPNMKMLVYTCNWGCIPEISCCFTLPLCKSSNYPCYCPVVEADRQQTAVCHGQEGYIYAERHSSVVFLQEQKCWIVHWHIVTIAKFYTWPNSATGGYKSASSGPVVEARRQLIVCHSEEGYLCTERHSSVVFLGKTLSLYTDTDCFHIYY